MGKYLCRRLLTGAFALLALVTITFFLMHAIPGSPFATEPGNLPEGINDDLAEQYGLYEPIHIRYIKYLGSALRGDFGKSLSHNGKDVRDIIMSELPYTASLGAVAFCIAVFAGLILGTAAAFSRRRWVKGALSFAASVGVSIPSFLLALFFMMLFGVALGWLPIVGLTTWRHYIMPGIALAVPPIAMISRLTKTSLSEVMGQDYMVLAKSKGTDRMKMITRHALKNALIPVVTYAGPLLATLLTGSFVIETLFSIPGIGAEFVTSVSDSDYIMIMALIIFQGEFIIIANILSDLIAAVLDPRIRLK